MSEALDFILDGTGLNYLVSSDGYLLINQAEETVEFVGVQETITGTVIDAETREALTGVTVVVEGSQEVTGSTIGTTTNFEGYYEIELPEGLNTLVFSYIGYQRMEVETNGRTEINIELNSDVQLLDDVVVVGYGTQDRSDITGSVHSISARDLSEVRNVTNPQEMLQGRAAGVDVVSTGNKPGDGVSVTIRGRRSFNAGNDPLYVVDGIPINGGFNDISPADISSITVLKDASATAIYGSRGANGVVIITTKRGEPGSINVNWNSSLGASKIYNKPDIMSGPEYAEFVRDTRRAAGLYDDSDPNADNQLFEAVELEGIALGRTTDYYGRLIRNGFNQNHNLSISGGSENTRFLLSAGVQEDVGIVKNQDFTRYNTRINIDQTISDRFRAGASIMGSFSERSGEDWNALITATSEIPLGVPYDENGELLLRTTQRDPLLINPLLDLEPGAVVNRRNTTRLLGNLYGEVDFIQGFNFRMNFGPDISHSKMGDFRAGRTTANEGGDSTAESEEETDFNYTWENILNYTTTLAEDHAMDLTGLYSLQTSRSEESGLSVINLPLDRFEYYNVGSAERINNVNSSFRKFTLESYMLRVNYEYANRFNVTGTIRADGSSKFAEGNRWGYFPSAAVAWNISNEDFLNNNETISHLRLRLSWGSTGNQGIPPYQTTGRLSRTEYDYGGQPAFGFRPSSISNPDLTWESTRTANAGIDFELYEARISGSLEVYRSLTTDLLLPRLLPITSGFNSILTNVGTKRNTGIEFTLSTYNIAPQATGGFSWNTDLNLFTNKEEIVELSQGKVDDIGNQRFIGHPAVVFFDYDYDGIWQVGEEELAEQNNSAVGHIKVRDVNGDGIITPEDRVILGSDVPDLVGGMTHRFGYKGFDLSVVAYARLGHLIESAHYGTQHTDGRRNLLNYDYWMPDNTDAYFPQPNVNIEFPYYESTIRIFDGSFLKIRSINIGYELPQSFVQKLGIRSLRLYANLHNPIMFSPFTSKWGGDDPENTTRNTPLSKSFIGGWEINF
ncbi:MAG: TonB-dependent receptor [Balneolaceae bacterium]